MVIRRCIDGLACVALASCLAACASAAGEDDASRDATVEEEQNFTSAPKQPNHEEITAEGLPFLAGPILTALQAANVSTDAQFAFVSANHFDDCNFSGGSKVIADSEEQAVQALNPALASPASDAAAILAFGRALHAAQDFYSHTNWVELGAVGLVDSSLSPFHALKGYEILDPSGVQIVEGNPPPKTVVWRRVGAPYPQSAVVYVREADVLHDGLISGSVDYEPGDLCPVWVRMPHASLNKDESGLPERQAQYVSARSLAVQQTHHEWCRLVALTNAAWGSAGVDRLSTWVVDGDAAASCE